MPASEQPPAKIPLTEFSRRWDEIVEQVVRTSRSMWVKANLPMAKLSRVADSTLTLHLPPFVLRDAKGSFEEIDLRKKVEEALANITDEKVSVTLVADETLRPTHPVEEEERETSVSDESVSETVRLIRKVFPGAVVEGK